MRKYTTKWREIDDTQRAWMEKTTCGLKCAGCGITLVTEADFAKHFVVPDRRYLNLGDCPTLVLVPDEEVV